VAKVTVTADRAVLGQFPPVCVRTGERADGYVTIESKVGGPSAWALLLLLLGPIGWIVLVGIALAMRGEPYSVRLPYQESAWESIRRTSIVGYALFGAAVLVLLAGVLMQQERNGVVGAIALGVVAVVVTTYAKAMLPRLQLDATRRWVTIRDVHPFFAEATRALEPTHPANR
jgi:hypothetical protein